MLIPCMYMLLIVYSFTNINNVSWGTREAALTSSEQQQAAKAEEERAKAAAAKRPSLVNSLLGFWKGMMAA